MTATSLAVAVCLWPCLSYCAGSALAFVARHWSWFRWLRPVPVAVLGAFANVMGAALSGVAVWLA